MGTEVSTPIADFARQYACSGTARLHMPGHKGHAILGCEPLDLTEIRGADELYAADGIIAESERNAARLFGTARTFYSTEGSSQCIRAMLFLAMQARPTAKGRPLLLAARNAHKALLYAAALLDFEIEWLWPAPDEGGTLCACPVRPDAVRAALSALPQKPFGVYVTSPDYLGGVQEIAALAEVCAAAGAPLLVDNAHGAYLHFLPGESRHPIALGAAMCCDSGHKTLPVLTGGAYLHFGPNAPIQKEAAVRGALALFGSTSPSYLILQSLDLCNRALAGEWPRRLAACVDTLAALRREINASAQAAGCPVPLILDGKGREPLKLTLDAAALGRTGAALADRLRRAGIECEYADPRFVVLMASPDNTPEELARVREALRAALAEKSARHGPQKGDAEAFAALAREASPCLSVRQAMFAPQEIVPAGEALGRVCAMPTVSCPPAVPIAVSGERIGPAAVRLLERYGIDRVAVVTKS